MEFLDCVKGRRSIRNFKSEKIDHAVLQKVVQAAAYAPSWKNTQIARYVVIENEAIKNDIAENCVMGFAHNTAIIQNAPAIVVVTYIAGRSGFERDGSFSTIKEDLSLIHI